MMENYTKEYETLRTVSSAIELSNGLIKTVLRKRNVDGFSANTTRSILANQFLVQLQNQFNKELGAQLNDRR